MPWFQVRSTCFPQSGPTVPSPCRAGLRPTLGPWPLAERSPGPVPSAQRDSLTEGQGARQDPQQLRSSAGRRQWEGPGLAKEAKQRGAWVGFRKDPAGLGAKLRSGMGGPRVGQDASRDTHGRDRAARAPAARQALRAHSDLGAVTTEKPAWPPFEEGQAARPQALGRRKGLPDPQPVDSFRAGPEADPGPAVSQPRTQDDPEDTRLLLPPNTASPPISPVS